ncbi:TauD/TfdA family dioxygenase [Candidatus Vondammii sp. HM_W22]|uniref:TauD/TfdA family dioxygenase n=1 Tax=Candidatus Vondammii sp. HM_W22 TaxID=2687299 RepID=UPI001F136685|nr:TauD/TfdA family dioxygenase [Candidatus Vondammii sp. HM_W22]
MQTNSPYYLHDNDAYKSWCDEKLQNYPASLEDLIVEINDQQHLTPAEHQAVMTLIKKVGMAIYASHNGNPHDKELIRSLGLQFGLDHLDHNMCADEDAITSLAVQPDALHKGYIPYSNRPIAWHTDGYYNNMSQQIHGLLLHCVQPAANGGANEFLDHEIIYMQLRDINPIYIHALMNPEAMTIPANIVDGKELRPARTGPVFQIRNDGRLHMRYTDRSRSIEWRDDPATQEAVTELKRLLRADSPYHFKGTLQAGQGLISNNTLHTRDSFEDGDSERLLYRARYFDSIKGA